MIIVTFYLILTC